jgi:hypothetical protein
MKQSRFLELAGVASPNVQSKILMESMDSAKVANIAASVFKLAEESVYAENEEDKVTPTGDQIMKAANAIMTAVKDEVAAKISSNK